MAAVLLVFCASYTIFGLVALLANSAALLELQHTKKKDTVLDTTWTSIFLANIISDLCFLASGCLFVYQCVYHEIPIESITVLIVLQFANRCATCISFLHVVFITVQRLASTTFSPLRFKCILTAKIANFISILIWIAGLAIVSMYHSIHTVDGNPDAPISKASFVIGAIMLLSYAWVFFFLANGASASKQFTNSIQTQSDDNNSNNMKMFLNSLGLTLLFIVFMIPCPKMVRSGRNDADVRILFTIFLIFKTVCDPSLYFYIVSSRFSEEDKTSAEEERQRLEEFPQKSIPFV